MIKDPTQEIAGSQYYCIDIPEKNGGMYRILIAKSMIDMHPPERQAEALDEIIIRHLGTLYTEDCRNYGS